MKLPGMHVHKKEEKQQQPQVVVVQNQPGSQKICKKCGTILSVNEKFCSHCGNKLK